MGNVAKLASIFWAPLKAERQYGGPYQISGVLLGAPPAILTIPDAYQVEYGPYEGRATRKFERRVVDAYTIAADLVREWAETGVRMNPNCRPGIWVVRDRFPELNEDGIPMVDAGGMAIWRPATEGEKAEMFAEDLEAAKVAQVTYARAEFNEAEGIYKNDPRKRNFLPRNAILGARYYGMDAEWTKEGAELKTKACPLCTKAINDAAMRCPYCQGIVDWAAHAAYEFKGKESARAQQEALRKTA